MMSRPASHVRPGDKRKHCQGRSSRLLMQAGSVVNLFPAVVASLLLGVTVVHAQSTVKPISGIPVGLEGDQGPVAAPRTTDRLGNVVFTDLVPGRYTVFIPEASRLDAPVQVRASTGSSAARSQTYIIQPSRDRAYALDSRGQRMVLSPSRAGGRISLNVSSIFDRGQEGPMSSY